MKTRKELALKDCVKQLNAVQESFIVNKSFSIAERLKVINYIDTVKNELSSVLTSENK